MKPIRRPFHEFIQSASEYTKVEPDEITGYARARAVIDARWLVIWNARQSGYSLTEIGNGLNRDHTTILHACQRMGI